MNIIISYIKLTIIIQCYENTSITTICRLSLIHIYVLEYKYIRQSGIKTFN